MTYPLVPSTTLNEMSMSELKAHAKSIGTKAPEGTGHRKTGWIKAIERKQDKLIAVQNQTSFAKTEMSTDEMIVAGLLEAPTLGSIQEYQDSVVAAEAVLVLNQAGCRILPADDNDDAVCEIALGDRFITYIYERDNLFYCLDWLCGDKFPTIELAAADNLKHCHPTKYQAALACLSN